MQILHNVPVQTIVSRILWVDRNLDGSRAILADADGAHLVRMAWMRLLKNICFSSFDTHAISQWHHSPRVWKEGRLYRSDVEDSDVEPNVISPRGQMTERAGFKGVFLMDALTLDLNRSAFSLSLEAATLRCRVALIGIVNSSVSLLFTAGSVIVSARSLNDRSALSGKASRTRWYP
jgi:hypothetical protein